MEGVGGKAGYSVPMDPGGCGKSGRRPAFGSAGTGNPYPGDFTGMRKQIQERSPVLEALEGQILFWELLT